MLYQFQWRNLSFLYKTVLSMDAVDDENRLGNIVQLEKERVLKVATIFGANAAVKSNLFFCSYCSYFNDNTFKS